MKLIFISFKEKKTLMYFKNRTSKSVFFIKIYKINGKRQIFLDIYSYSQNLAYTDINNKNRREKEYKYIY